MTNGAQSTGDRLATIRTRLAYDRTLMAWVRTAASFISFGFSIYKFFDAMRQAEVTHATRGLLGPREFALVMIATGVGALALATLDHQRSLRALTLEYGQAGGESRSLAGLMAGLVVGLGSIGLLMVFFRQ